MNTIERPTTGQNGKLKAEIRKADDGYSLFTWQDLGNHGGIVNWRERHTMEWKDAHSQFCAWLKD